MKPKSRTTVQNPNAGTSTGTHRTRITGIDGRLVVGVALMWVRATGTGAGRPSAFTGNTFKLYGVSYNADGSRERLSDTPLNGASGQNAPDGWEGRTLLPEIEVEHSYTGINSASTTGHWEVCVYAAPAIDMCDEDFQALWNQVDVQLVDGPVTVT